MCGRVTVSAHVHWGDAKGHHSGGQIPLKWHPRQTSTDKVVPFLCPLPQRTVTLHCAPGTEKFGGWREPWEQKQMETEIFWR